MEHNYETMDAIIDTCANDLIIKWRMSDLCNYKCSYCARVYLSGKDKRHIESEQHLLDTEKQLIEIADNITRFIQGYNYKSIKLDLIGGEPCIFNLKEIINHIVTDGLRKINITTNFSRDYEYYKDFLEYCLSRKIDVTLTASFHSEFVDYSTYFEKVKQVRDLHIGTINCELVSRINNQDDCVKLRDDCLANNLEYKIEADLSHEKGQGNLMKDGNIGKDGRKKYLVLNRYEGIYYTDHMIELGENEEIYNVTGNRYIVFYQDGEYELFSTRNKLLTDPRFMSEIRESPAIRTHGCYCTHSINHIYILYDVVVGKNYILPRIGCRDHIKIGRFKIPDISVHRCDAGPHGCTMCGNGISVAKSLCFLTRIPEKNNYY